MFLRRIIGAAGLEASLFQEVKHDPVATAQGLIIVLTVALVTGLVGAPKFAWALVAARVLWVLAVFIFLSLVIHWTGVKFFGGRATRWEAIRCTGFAYAPMLLMVLAFIPPVGEVLVWISLAWALVAMVAAVREALSVESARAVAVAITGWGITLALTAALVAVGLGIGPGMMLF